MRCRSRLEDCLNILYGGPRPPAVEPQDIPCKEIRDCERLCKDPLVSVRIVTYNHEPYIRQCLESVVLQKTDFAYEVVVSDDCSSDGTFSICKEFQKRYPEKVRVLWAEVNVNQMGGGGGNSVRAAYHCRGTYLALLEGDDFWSDPCKLQKQIDLIRSQNAIGCVANYDKLNLDGSIEPTRHSAPKGQLHYEDMLRCYLHTSTYVMRRSAHFEVRQAYPAIRIWYDITLIHGLIGLGKVVFLPDAVSVYRITGKGIETKLRGCAKRLVAIRLYLDLYLNGPSEVRARFGDKILKHAAAFFKLAAKNPFDATAAKYSKAVSRIFWSVYCSQPWRYRSLRTLIRYGLSQMKIKFEKGGDVSNEDPATAKKSNLARG